MADSFTTFLQVRLPATGAYNNTWGATLNSDALNLLDTAITGWSAVNIGSATGYNLPAMTQGAASLARYFSITFVGTATSPVTVTLPPSVVGKQYLINNQTGQTLTFTYGGSGTTVTLQIGVLQFIWCDGTNVSFPAAGANSAEELGGVPAANWVRQSRTAAEITADTIVTNSITIPTAWPYQTVTEAPTTTLDCNEGNSQILTLTGNRVMAQPVNVQDGSLIDLLVVQDGTGGRTLTWSSAFLFVNGLTPTLATAPGAIDRFPMIYNAGLAKWLVGQFGNLNTGAGTTLPITVSGNTIDWSLTAILGALGAPATINILVPKGVIMEASTAGTPAMDLSGLISGCTVNLINLGWILGRGGRGGNGGGAQYPGSGATLIDGSKGMPGGRAILGPGSGCTFNITNGNGNIWGGGGGGGGGGVSINLTTPGVGNGGGGGAGAGGAPGGLPGLQRFTGGGLAVAGYGGDSTSGINGTFGANGAGASIGTGAGAAGGAGGNWGAAGAAGTAATSLPNQAAAGSGGAAGKAIELQGGAATFVSGGGSPNVQGVVS